MTDFKLNNDQISELIAIHKSIKNKKIAYKINAIILLEKGYSYEEIHEVLLLDERTIRRYRPPLSLRDISPFARGRIITTPLTKGRLRGVENKYKGGQSKLLKEQEKELTRYIENNIFSTAAEICRFVKKKFNVEYSPEGMVHTLHRLGFSYKKTPPLPFGHLPLRKGEKYIPLTKGDNRGLNLRKNQKPTEKVYFMDGVHPTHNVMPAYAWIKKGKEKEVKSNSGRQRININGVYSPDDGEIIVRNDERINSQSTINLLRTIEEKHPELTKIYIIRDNARYYVSKEVQKYIRTSKIEFIPLPTYSLPPSCPPLRRGDVRGVKGYGNFLKKILYNKYYESFDIFKQVVNDFFVKDIKLYKDEIEKLLTENFHLFNAIEEKL